MFGIGGERDLSERELPHLAGWRDSRPVRVGNGAWNQRQLDVYGELLGAAERLVQQLGELDPVTQQFLAAAADTAASRWKEKDQGIWEIRGEPRDFLYSKLMCWAALNRAIALAPQLGARHRVEEWAAARDEIRAAILARGWSEKAGAFTQAFGSEDLDASNLMLAITGFLPGDDPRMKATIDATAARLTDEPRPGLPLPRSRRPGRRGGNLPALHVLAGTGAGTCGRAGPGHGDLRAGSGGGQRRGPAGRGDRRRQRRDDRQLPAGVQPHRPDQRRLGHQPSPGTRRPPRPNRSGRFRQVVGNRS